MGRYCNICEGVVIRPPGKIYKGLEWFCNHDANGGRSFTFYPVRIGDCVTIGQNSIVEAAQIGLGVDIGKECIIVCLPVHVTPMN